MEKESIKEVTAGLWVHSAMVLLLSYLWNPTRTDAPSGSLGPGPGSNEFTVTMKSFLVEG